MPKQEKEKSKLAKLSKKIQKKEKRFKILAQNVKDTVAEQDKIIKKKKEFEAELLKVKDQMEEEKVEVSIGQISSQVENLYRKLIIKVVNYF